MRWYLVVAVVLLAPYIAFTPPGLCPCWLMMEPGQFHPHPSGRPDHPHTHDYLFDLFQSQTATATPLALLPAGLLIALQAASGLRRPLPDVVHDGASWTPLPPRPPPRLLLSW
jgi:hypothetical protein